MDWQKFTYKGVDYDLSHLQNMELEFVQPSNDGKPALSHFVLVDFSLHCFSQKIKPGDDPALRVADHREERTFCFKRYALSKLLPEIMRTFDQQKCKHTGHGNFVRIVFPDFEGERVEYVVFFKPSKTKVNGRTRVRLYIQSAHVKDNRAYEPKARKARSVGLFVILHNTLHNKPIRG